MNRFVLVAALALVIGESRGQDLSEPIHPGFLPFLYRIAFEEAKFEDLRSKTTEISGVRLLCLNDRFPCYEFSVMIQKDGKILLQWAVFVRSNKEEKKSGKGSKNLDAQEWNRISKALRSDEFTSIPVATMPVAVGHPYVFMFEVFEEDGYRVVFRDGPKYSPEKRKLKEFNALATAIISASGLRDSSFSIPEEWFEKKEQENSNQVVSTFLLIPAEPEKSSTEC